MDKRTAVFAGGSEQARPGTPGRVRAALLLGGLTFALLVLVLLGPAPADANEPPLITCPADKVAEATGNNSATVNPGNATATDPDGDPVSVTDPPEASFALGTTPVTHTATDVFGNSSTCSQNITVVDTTSPSITCPANITAIAGAGGTAAVTYPPASATDIAGGTTVSYSSASGSPFPIGTTVVTATAVDQSGNSSSCVFTVTVQPGPTSKADCKNGHWRDFGSVFRNQGECVTLFGT